MDDLLDKISKKVAQEHKDLDKKAKGLLHILVCGSYDGMDIEIIEKFRDMQRKKQISGVFLMKDIQLRVGESEIEPPLHEKLHHIWTIMKQGDNIPIIVLFAGQSASHSQGLNAEIQTISHDPEKIKCAYLFKTEDVQLVSHEKCFTHVNVVTDEREFIQQADEIVQAHLNQAKMFYQDEGKRKNE